jgi:hypothetical protein
MAHELVKKHYLLLAQQRDRKRPLALHPSWRHTNVAAGGGARAAPTSSQPSSPPGSPISASAEADARQTVAASSEHNRSTPLFRLLLSEDLRALLLRALSVSSLLLCRRTCTALREYMSAFLRHSVPRPIVFGGTSGGDWRGVDVAERPGNGVPGRAREPCCAEELHWLGPAAATSGGYRAGGLDGEGSARWHPVLSICGRLGLAPTPPFVLGQKDAALWVGMVSHPPRKIHAVCIASYV